MHSCDHPEAAKLHNVIDVGLGFSAMLRLYSSGSKKKLHNKICSDVRELFAIGTQEAFTDWHSSFCEWGVEHIALTKGNVPASYGQVAKTLDVVLKVAVYYSHLPNYETATRLSPWLNAAVDTPMMAMLKGQYPTSFERWPKRVYQVGTKDMHDTLQGLVHRFIREKHLNISPVQFDDIYWRRLNRGQE